MDLKQLSFYSFFVIFFFKKKTKYLPCYLSDLANNLHDENKVQHVHQETLDNDLHISDQQHLQSIDNELQVIFCIK